MTRGKICASGSTIIDVFLMLTGFDYIRRVCEADLLYCVKLCQFITSSLQCLFKTVSVYSRGSLV